jgi:hypothetical protein
MNGDRIVSRRRRSSEKAGTPKDGDVNDGTNLRLDETMTMECGIYKLSETI